MLTVRKKSREQDIYDFENDDIIENLSQQILTILEFKINSREKLYSTAEELENKIAENLERVKKLSAEIPMLKEKIKSKSASEELTQRYELLPRFIESLKAEIEHDRLKLSRVSNVIENHERISGGDYIGSIVREQQSQAARAWQEREQAHSKSELQASRQHHKGLK